MLNLKLTEKTLYGDKLFLDFPSSVFYGNNGYEISGFIFLVPIPEDDNLSVYKADKRIQKFYSSVALSGAGYYATNKTKALLENRAEKMLALSNVFIMRYPKREAILSEELYRTIKQMCFS